MKKINWEDASFAYFWKGFFKMKILIKKSFVAWQLLKELQGATESILCFGNA